MKILGQDVVRQYLTRGLAADRLSPSLMFVGQEGWGKRTVATELAKALLCEKPVQTPHPGELRNCDQCLPCQKVNARTHPDVLLIDYDFQQVQAKSKLAQQFTIKIESIRHLLKFLSLKPVEGTRRIIIIDEAHTMTTEAANSLLKILEEPPHGAQLILLARDERNLPSTILSRCGILHFHPIKTQDITHWLVHHEHIPQNRAAFIANQANGSLSKALSSIEDEDLEFNLNDYDLEEFFDLVAQPSFKRESRKKAGKILALLLDEAQMKLEAGDLARQKEIELILQAKKQIERYISPRLVLENFYLRIQDYRYT